MKAIKRVIRMFEQDKGRTQCNSGYFHVPRQVFGLSEGTETTPKIIRMTQRNIKLSNFILIILISITFYYYILVIVLVLLLYFSIIIIIIIVPRSHPVESGN